MPTKLLLLLLWITPFGALATDEPTVLLIHSYHPQYPWTEKQSQGIKDILMTSIHAENLHIEYMDERRFVDDRVFNTKLIALLKHKYQKYEPDIIITTDDHAFYFMVDYGESLFPGKPIVFSGVNVFEPDTIIKRKNIIGIKEGIEIESNLELILQVQPETKRIIMLSDTTGLGLHMTERAKEIKSHWQNDPKSKQVTLEIWDRLSIDELLQKAANIETDTVFLF